MTDLGPRQAGKADLPPRLPFATEILGKPRTDRASASIRKHHVLSCIQIASLTKPHIELGSLPPTNHGRSIPLFTFPPSNTTFVSQSTATQSRIPPHRDTIVKTPPPLPQLPTTLANIARTNHRSRELLVTSEHVPRYRPVERAQTQGSECTCTAEAVPSRIEHSSSKPLTLGADTRRHQPQHCSPPTRLDHEAIQFQQHRQLPGQPCPLHVGI